MNDDIDSATHKDQLTPNYEAIRKNIGVLSAGERTFLAALYVFYNADDGQKLLEGMNCPTMHDIRKILR